MRTWVFTHGSLMNDPPFPVVHSVVAEAPGWSRTFGHPSVRNWGTHRAPAPTSSLVAGGHAVGVAHLIDARLVDRIVAREASDPVHIGIRVDGTPRRALTWTMTDHWADWTADQLAHAARRNVAAGGGPLGDARGYLATVIEALRVHGRSDSSATLYWRACTWMTADDRLGPGMAG